MAHDDDAVQLHAIERQLFDGPEDIRPGTTPLAEALTVAIFGGEADGPPPRSLGMSSEPSS